MRDKLMEVALNHFADRGVEGASLAEIATDADSSSEELSSKEALFEECAAAALEGLGADLLALADIEDDAAERLLQMTRRLATASTVEGLALFVISRELLDGQPRAVRAFRASLDESIEAFFRILGEAQFRGQVIPLPPRFLLTVLFAGVVFPQVIGWGDAEGRLGGILERDETPGAPVRSALLAASLEAVFNGLLTQPIDLDPRPIH